MKKNCAFTIVAKNYIGLAKVLEKSILENYQDLDFYIIVADELGKLDLAFDQHNINILEAKNLLEIPENIWTEMSFKYNLTEFCTAIKPYSILYFFKSGYDKVIYLDPDIKFFSSIGPIYSELDSHLVVLSPHILTIPSDCYQGFSELFILNVGIYNLGFIAVRKDSCTIPFIEWWARKLKEMAFNDKYRALFTDQIWINFITSFIPNEKLCISRDCGRDVAPWNFEERELCIKDGKPFVRLKNENDIDELMFIHFSGYDYISLMNGHIKSKGSSDINKFPEYEPLILGYGEDLSDYLPTYINLKYSYNYYDDGTLIKSHHRRIFYNLKENGYDTGNPFKADGVFVKLLDNNGFKREKVVQSSSQITTQRISKEKKFKYLHIFSKWLFRLLGEKRYFEVLRAFYYISNEDHQTHLLKLNKSK